MNKIAELSQKGQELKRRVSKMAEENGVWRTIQGRAIFIPTGGSVEDAMKKGGLSRKAAGNAGGSGKIITGPKSGLSLDKAHIALKKAAMRDLVKGKRVRVDGGFRSTGVIQKVDKVRFRVQISFAPDSSGMGSLAWHPIEDIRP